MFWGALTITDAEATINFLAYEDHYDKGHYPETNLKIFEAY
jgi:hypothetical protein